MPDRIHLTVATVVEHQGRFLMVRETRDGRQLINQPAGHVEPGEDIRAAALRETLEETGWIVELQHLLGIYTYNAPANGATYYRVCFSATAKCQQPGATLDDDIDSWHWMDYGEICAERNNLRSELVMTCVEDFREARFYPLDLLREPV